jgi:hypothetical protein
LARYLPSLAAKHGFVIHGMLAAASLHLAHISRTGEERHVYQQTAAAQMNIGMSGYSTEIQEITTENAEALFAFSTIMTVLSLSTAATECELTLKTIRAAGNGADRNVALNSSLVHTVCSIFRSIRGILVILVPCWERLCRGTLQPIFQRSWWPHPVPVTPDEIRDDQKIRYLEKMWSTPSGA